MFTWPMWTVVDPTKALEDRPDRFRLCVIVVTFHENDHSLVYHNVIECHFFVDGPRQCLFYLLQSAYV